MKLMSKDFADKSSIPAEFTCDGRDVSPNLSWEDVPSETKSFALLVADPDSVGGMWIHWLVHDIAKDVRLIEKNSLPKGAKEVSNDFGQKQYGGPCPPSGTHRYFFTLYALDVDYLEDVNKRNFRNKVEGHAIAKAEIMGLYKRKR